MKYESGKLVQIVVILSCSVRSSIEGSILSVNLNSYILDHGHLIFRETMPAVGVWIRKATLRVLPMRRQSSMSAKGILVLRVFARKDGNITENLVTW